MNRAHHVDYVPTIFVHTLSTMTEEKVSLIEEREKRVLNRRMIEISDQDVRFATHDGMVPSDKSVDENDDNASTVSDGNGQDENNTEDMNSEEQEEVEIGNGDNENYDEELRVDDTEAEGSDEHFVGSVEVSSGEPNEQGSETSDELVVDGEVNEPDSDNIGVEDSDNIGIKDSDNIGVEDSDNIGVEDSDNIGVEDSDLDIENCADEDDEEIQHLSIDAGVQVVASSSQNHSTPVQAPVLVPVACFVSKRSQNSQVSIIENNDEATKFYTGLSSWKLFDYLATSLVNAYPAKSSSEKLSTHEGLLLVLMRLRLNLRVEDLSYRFGCSLSSVSETFQRWIDRMFASLKCLIIWPSQEIIQSNMPQIFKELYPKTRCIIDCSEVFIERPCSYKARAQTYSNYKKHNTVKFLVGITPNGAISFLSKCWGGRASDKVITQNCGFLQLVEHGDLILADRGFNIADDLGVFGASLVVPSFTKGKQQLSLQEVELSKRLSKVRIHIERVIGILKNKYSILQSTLPINIVKHKHDTDYANIDKILTVCAALINLSPSIVPL